jgi:hypothetical protein
MTKLNEAWTAASQDLYNAMNTMEGAEGGQPNAIKEPEQMPSRVPEWRKQ